MRVSTCLSIAVNALAVYAAVTPSRTTAKRDSAASNFISTSNGNFVVNGSNFKFIGTNAYWLPYLNSDDDIDRTFANLSATGIKVLIANGTATVNTGPNGLQHLDKVMELAQKHGIYVLWSLTNNWNPVPNTTDSSNSTVARRNNAPTTPRNFLSNDYGGMDAYVREFGVAKQHDEFYTNETIKDLFKNYTKQVVSRFVTHPSVFSWEIANDARCNSSVPASASCNTNTVTAWHSEIADFIKTVDPNHLVSSG
ncbi:hypothetical protein EWM64_g1913, partial [Hericium alpestre]